MGRYTVISVMKKALVLLLLLSWSGAAFADEIGTPTNIFNDGEPADATKMNQNFDEVYQHVNDFDQFVSVNPAAKTVTIGKAGTTLITQSPISTRGSAPIGTIMAISKSLSSGLVDLQGQWAPCNGQLLSDPGSPMNGKTLPNLNGSKLFLRGTKSGTDQFKAGVIKDDQMQTHSHVSLGHTHGGGLTHTGGAVKKSAANAPGGSSAILGAVFSAIAKFGPPTALAGDPTVFTGDETRPKNMSVIWIIKIRP